MFENQNINIIRGNTVYIYGIFDDSITKNIIPQLRDLIEQQIQNKEGRIDFYISSPGGYIHILKNLLGLIEKAKSNNIIIATHVYAFAHSCGSALAISGTKGYRYISENAEELVHYGQIGGSVQTPLQAKRTKEEWDSHFKFVLKHYSKYAKIPGLKRKLTDDGFTVYGKQLIKYGMADHLI